MSEQTLATAVTDPATQNNQTAKTYTQEEVNDMMAKAKGNLAKKFESRYEDLGDIEELRALKASAEKRKQEEQIARGEFEKTLQELASKKDAEIQKRDAMIAAYKLDTPLLEESSKFRAIKPDQVKTLLRNQVRLNTEGAVEVVDNTGKVRYTDKGTPLSVSDLVQDFLNSNPHFVSPTPSTTNTKSSHVAEHATLDISKLDMTKKEDRARYAEYRKANNIS